MKSEHQFNSAQELKPELIEAIKLTFGNAPIRVIIEDVSKTNPQTKSSGKYSKELTDSILDIIFEQLSKSKK